MPQGRRGRPFNTTQPLGKLLYEQGFRVKDATIHCGIEVRLMSDYLTNTLPIKPSHAEMLADMLGCDPEDLAPDGPPKWLNAHKNKLNPAWAAQQDNLYIMGQGKYEAANG